MNNDKPARRCPEEEELLSRAKGLLMDRRGMTEEQAHRFLQKRSMDGGVKLVDTAKQVIEEIRLGNGA